MNEVNGKRRREESLIPPHGGYQNLKTFKLAEIIYDVTVLFCDKFISIRSRTHDQMVQAARSGKQNIAEGSVDSGTSKKIELKLTGISKGSLDELKLDYKDFLRHRKLPELPSQDPALMRFKERKCSSLKEFRAWVADEYKIEKKRRAGHDVTQGRRGTRTDTDRHGQTRANSEENKNTAPSTLSKQPSCALEIQTPSVSVRVCQCSHSLPSHSPILSSVPIEHFPAVLAANGALSLLNICIYLLDRQVNSQAKSFENEGGFTERIYRMRSDKRKNNVKNQTS